ncbi:MAG: PstS family phosphate ABC transporter substrate-binding protein [Planctomycetaceae bacterium]
MRSFFQSAIGPRRRRSVLSVVPALVAALVPAGVLVAQDDAPLPPYRKAAGEVTGSLKCVGSDTMNNLVALWVEGFKKSYPGVREGIEGKGSASAPPALTEGTASFGPMSRDWKPSEVDTFKEKHGYAPTVVPVAIDMLAVFVHKDNPIKSLSLEQVDAIFSRNRTGGAKTDIRTWGDLGLEGEWKNRPISLYGRNATSGTYGYFKEHALFKGDFKPTVKEQPGSSAVVQAVASDKAGIGYSGVGYATADVRAVPLAAKTGEEPVPTDPERAYSGDYPLARFLYLSVNRKPGSELDPLRREFLRYVLSAEGQADVKKDGYLPITGLVAKEALEGVGIAP